MLTVDERLKFEEFVQGWLEFSQAVDDDRLQQLRDSILAVYHQLDLKPPQIVFCRGQLQQILFPILINLMLRLGGQLSESSGLKRTAVEPMIVREGWLGLWDEAIASLDWQVIAGDTTGNGAPLQQRLERRIDRIMKIRLSAAAIEQLGMEKHDELEKLAQSRLIAPYQRLESALLLRGLELSHLWNSLIMRLPPEFLEELRRVRQEERDIEQKNSEQETEAESDRFASPGRRRLENVGPVPDSWHGGWDWHWFSYIEFARTHLGLNLETGLGEELDLWISLAKGASGYLFYDNVCYIFLKPVAIHFDEAGRPHHPSKAAIEFTDGTNLYIWHGIEVPERIITQPNKIFVRDIEAERNIEIRRIMIERYGMAQFIKDSGGKKIHEDSYGTLYRKEIVGDEALVVVRVKNATAEPDGTFKDYFLRVPPEFTQAKAAVAWTFGLGALDYQPTKET